ncbi:MAG: chorismate mutase [Epulopiscium sp. Nuni2H_MBin003]|nr:MAG: chorismate mutase [Epulopiscium sp. Nuni2H_MBin003]
MIVGYQGVEGSYSEEALIQYFGKEQLTKNYNQFEDVFIALEEGEIDYGVLPIENSTTGSISENYDLLKKYEYYIVAEINVKVRHNLLGIEGATIENITQIFSHPQGFEQCAKYLKTLNAKHVAYHNTAISAKYVKDTNDVQNAAIASNRAAEIYGLSILNSDISNVAQNVTRFIIISKIATTAKESNKMTLLFEIPNTIGSLYSILNQFAKEKVNLLKIESRPVGDGTFSYCFYIDIEGNMQNANIINALKNIEEVTKDFRILGNYIKSS